MAVAHTTLLEYLGKYVTFKVPVPIGSDQSLFRQVTGKVISVDIDLGGKHSLCILYDELGDSSEYFLYAEMIFI